LPNLSVSFIPDAKGVESLARQIRLTGRAYPMFEIAHLILRKPDRYEVMFGVVKNAEGQVAQGLWLCNVDQTLWLSEAEAIQHVLRKHFDTFYQTEKTPTDPPKGKYTFVAQCGLSGVVLGPPNYHDYQAKLARLHASRFSRMPFEVFKSKVRIVRDEEVVKKWVDDLSWKTEFTALNVPESVRLANREEVERHFREVHAPNIVQAVESLTLPGPVAQQVPSAMLRQVLRRAWDDQQRFPLKIVNLLSQQFASHGLQFFKVNKTVTHVAVARPHYLDLEVITVSDSVRRIVDFINGHPGCTRRQLFGKLAPSPAPAPATEAAAAPTAPATPPVASAAPPAAPAEGEAATPPSTPPPSTPASPPVSPEQAALISDLHWLIHQGHVIEFATGRLETAKKPLPKPPKPAPKTPEAPASNAAAAPESAPVVAAEPAVESAQDTGVAETSAAPEPAIAPASSSDIEAPVVPESASTQLPSSAAADAAGTA
jgi:hypothetical protein